MKKTFMSMVAALLVFLVSAPLAQAATPYVGLSAGAAFLTDSDIEVDGTEFDEAIEYKAGFAVNGAVGLDGDMYRVEGAIGYQVNDFDSMYGMEIPDDEDVEVAILSFMANGYLDIEMPSAPITPYVMAGVGLANVDFKFEDDSDDDTVFAYQLGAGIGFEASPNVTLDLGYRYFATSDVEPEDDVEVSIASHNVMAGVRVGF
ncbi:hypothetical protein CHL67_10190 [Prosthecochloris sp. GSB1]|uniref:outer membrane protein n=1 Tax=Prosthecochloris sp. GSB1 TaxID=281093 RepID=UPI000B8CB6E1|nr:outer membrane protein [Prosthecochloris sp. GSB1]ASQ91231.1 hypothetical protein CHL67_10190 [Prosthecochloris sp. GSB1]